MIKETLNKRTLLLICSFIAAILISGYTGYWWGSKSESGSTSSGWVTYTSGNPGFSLSYPPDWKSELSKDGYLLLKGPVDDKGRTPNILVQVLNPNRNYSTADDVALALLDQIKTNKEQTLISYTQTKISNKSAGELVYVYMYKGLKLKQHQVVFKDDKIGGYIYKVIFTSPAESYPAYIGVFEKFKRTFRLAG